MQSTGACRRRVIENCSVVTGCGISHNAGVEGSIPSLSTNQINNLRGLSWSMAFCMPRSDGGRTAAFDERTFECVLSLTAARLRFEVVS
jgi:hypothetical protein